MSLGGACGWSATAVVVVESVAADCVSCAQAGVAASVTAKASGLTAAAKREREEMLIISEVPLKPGRLTIGQNSFGPDGPLSGAEIIRGLRSRNGGAPLYIRIQHAKNSR